MASKTATNIGMAVVVACVAANVVMLRRNDPKPTASTQRPGERQGEGASTSHGPVPAPGVSNAGSPRSNHSAPRPIRTFAPRRSPSPADTSPATEPVELPAEPPPDPNAQAYDSSLLREFAPRLSLSFVGVDAYAEAIWFDAINDPTRSPKERQNLIEDLNEDGFPDPKHVTPADLPLIQSRINIIEQLAPFTLDSVNAAAFDEAYKDLLEMRDKASNP